MRDILLAIWHKRFFVSRPSSEGDYDGFPTGSRGSRSHDRRKSEQSRAGGRTRDCLEEVATAATDPLRNFPRAPETSQPKITPNSSPLSRYTSRGTNSKHFFGTRRADHKLSRAFIICHGASVVRSGVE